MVASASATSLKASAFVDSSVMELAMRSASVKSRAARSGSVGATAFAMLHSAAAFLNLTAVAAPPRNLTGMELAMRSARSASSGR